MSKKIQKKKAPASSKGSSLPPTLSEVLVPLISAELNELAHCPIGELVDAEGLADFIESAKTDFIKRDAIGHILLTYWEMLEKDLKKKEVSARDLLDDKTIKAIDSLLDGFTFSRRGEKWLTRILEQPFIHELLVDVIHLSIVNFYKKINPFFGGLATAVLEKQIKGFIGIFIPMVQARVTEFILQKDHLEIFLDFSRAIVRMILEEPISELVPSPSGSQKKKAMQVAQALLSSHKLEAFCREAAAAAVRGLFTILSKKTLADFVETSALDDLSHELLKAAWPVISRPRMAKFAGALALHMTAFSNSNP